MPYANNGGVHIHYEVEGQGPPLVLQHSLTRNLQAWRQLGYTEELKKKYRLILVDARGHGQSDKPHEPESYRMDVVANDVVAVLDDLGIGKAHYVGYSLGAIIGFAVARYALSRFNSLILGGGSPYVDDAVKQLSGQIKGVLQMAVEQGMGVWIALREQMAGRALSSEERTRELANDPHAFLALMEAMLKWADTPVEDALTAVTIPCLIYVGDADPYCRGARESARHIPNATFICVPGLDHTAGLERIDVALPIIKNFLAKVNKV